MAGSSFSFTVSTLIFPPVFRCLTIDYKDKKLGFSMPSNRHDHNGTKKRDDFGDRCCLNHDLLVIWSCARDSFCTKTTRKSYRLDDNKIPGTHVRACFGVSGKQGQTRAKKRATDEPATVVNAGVNLGGSTVS